MKLLLDSCVWGGAKNELIALGYDVIWSGDWVADPGDEAILIAAHQDGRVLVTLDKDFGELATVRGIRHSGIIRLVGFRAREQPAVCVRVLELHGKEIALGYLATARPGQLRLRPPNPDADD